MLVKKRINFKLFTILSLIVALGVALAAKNYLLALFTLTQYSAFWFFYHISVSMIYTERYTKKKLFWMSLLKSFMTFVPFALLAFLFPELLMWGLLSYILILLIFFLSITKDG